MGDEGRRITEHELPSVLAKGTVYFGNRICPFAHRAWWTSKEVCVCACVTSRLTHTHTHTHTLTHSLTHSHSFITLTPSPACFYLLQEAL